jgi:UMF1 family MFS transporter
VLYDLANTIFSMGVVSMYLPMWVREVVGPERADATVGTVTSISMALIFVLSPVLGSMTDRAERRLPFLTVATIGCVALTLMLGRVGYVGSLLAFVFANAFYQAGLQFYDALLPSVSTPLNRGKISGIGVAVGYIGSFLAIGINLLSPRFGWSTATAFAFAAVLYVLFSLPCFFFVEEAKNPSPSDVWSLREIASALRRTVHTLKASEEHPTLRRFLIGRLFYTDPINTVIAVMTLYSINVAQSSGITGTSPKVVATWVMFGAVVFAILGGYVAGTLVDKWGPRRVLRGVLSIWVVTFLVAASMGLLGLPWQLLLLVSALAGVALGGTWAADRPLMLELTPPERLGEFYGLYGMVGRFAAIIGPAIWAISMSTLHWLGWSTLRAQGMSVVVLLLLVLYSQYLLRPVLLATPKRNA